MTPKSFVGALVWACALAFVVRLLAMPTSSGEEAPVPPPIVVSTPAEGERSGSTAVRGTALQSLIAREPMPAPAASQLSIIGYALWESGEPIGNARIVANPKSAWTNGMADRLRERLRATRVREQYTSTATTDAAGRFELVGLRDLTYRVTGSRRGVHISGVSGVQAGAFTLITAKATVGSSMELDLRLPDGSSPETGSVALRVGYQGTSHSWTREKPVIAIDATGVVRVRASAEPNYVSDWVDLDLARLTSPPRIELHPMGAIRFSVLTADPRCSKWPRLRVLRIDPARPPSPSNLMFGREYSSHSRGELVLREVPQGTYMVGIGSGRIWTSEVVQVEFELVDVELNLLDPDPTGCLLARVVGPKGEAIDDANFSRTIQRKNGRRSGGVGESLLGEDGVYRILLSGNELAESMQPDAVLTLSLQVREQGKLNQVITAGTPQPIEFRFGEKSAVTLAFTGELSGRDKIFVQLVKPGVGPERFGAHRSNRRRDGASASIQNLGTVQAGSYDLVASVGLGFQALEISRVPVTVAAGAQEFSIALPALYPLKLVETEAARSTLLQFRRSEADSPITLHFSRRDDRTLWLPAGEYQIQDARTRGEWRTISVPKDSSLDLGGER